MPKAMIWGESLVGGGHARIQSELARRLQALGWDVCFVTSSKQHTDNFDFGAAKILYQAPLRLKSSECDPYNMGHLITPNGQSLLSDEQYRLERRAKLLEFYRAQRPDVVVTEMWPYARANFDFELVPLATEIRADACACGEEGPRMYSIARDIMFPPRLSSPDSPNLNNDRHGVADAFFDPHSIMVRGDPNFVPLEFSVGDIPPSMREKIDYVGYFATPSPPREVRMDDALRPVLVSSGGGVTRDSMILFQKSIEARKFSSLRAHPWRIFVPQGCPEDSFQALAAQAAAEAPEGGVVVERNRRDFLNLLANASLLICHAGNTVIESVTAGVPVLVAPRSLSKNNYEQQIRANAFYDRGLIELADQYLTESPEALARKVDSALGVQRPSAPIMVDGAARMAERITADFHRRRAAAPALALRHA